MPILFKNQGIKKVLVPGIEARLIHLKSLMTLVSEIKLGVQEAPLPYHTHDAEQTTYILEGKLQVFIEGEEPCEIGPGDLYYVASGVPHTIRSLSPVVRVVESFSPPRREFI